MVRHTCSGPTFYTQIRNFSHFSSELKKKPSFGDIHNVFDGADLNENIDENVEEIELEISPINPEDFDFVGETETYS